MNPVALKPADASAASRQALRARLIHDMNEWCRAQGLPVDARAYLDEHPELVDHETDLAYDEYCQRSSAGDEPDFESFLARFPNHQNSLARQLMTHLSLEVAPHLVPSLTEQLEPTAFPRPGEKVLGFKLVRELGEGAFSRVYLAHQEDLGNRPVVVKISRLASDEPNILGQLQHDNIMPVHSLVMDASTGWTIVCMPYLGEATFRDVLVTAFAGGKPPERGQVLADMLRAEASKASECPEWMQSSYEDAVVAMGMQLAQALQFVHDRKIFHRDLKPLNILLGADGRPRLLDFNLSFDTKTRERLLGGTLPYMSPEQLRATDEQFTGPAECLDARADIFSLGVILYELLTGKHPFGPVAGQLAQQRGCLLERIPRGPAPLRSLNPRVAPAAAAAIERCLAARAEDRLASAAQLARGLRPPAPPPAKKRSRLRRALVAAAILAVLSTASVFAFRAFRAPPPEDPYRQGIEAYHHGRHALALEYFTKAVERDPSCKTLFWRARASMRLGQWDRAIADLLQATSLNPDGPVYACLAYCYSRSDTPRYDLAIEYYQKAVQHGCESAIIYSNLGDACRRHKGALADAARYLHKAIALDNKLQLAYHNLALVELRKAQLQKDYVPREGMMAIHKAIETGKGNGFLYYDAVCLWAFAIAREPDQPRKQQAFAFVSKAVEFGLPPADLLRDPSLARLREDAAFHAALQTPPRVALDRPMRHSLDPVPNPAE